VNKLTINDVKFVSILYTKHMKREHGEK